jgi:predicted transcriptional regulator
MLPELRNTLHFVMAIVSIRLPDDVVLSLNREAERTQRAKSEIARDAISQYLKRQERDRFLAEIARAARAGSESEALELADEALPLDNEALERTEGFMGVSEPRAKYKTSRKKR